MHRLYQADLETQQIHELDTLDFKACERFKIFEEAPLDNQQWIDD